MIDYYLNPFAAPDDLQVIGAIANQVNAGENTGICQAPHHFEIWRLGEVTADGRILEAKELLATCDALVRAKPGKTDPGESQHARLNGHLPRQEVSPGPAGSSTTQVP